MHPENHDKTTLDAIVQALSEPVFVVDEHGRYVDVLGGNGSASDSAPATLIGKSLHDVLPSDVADGLLLSIQATLQRNAAHTQEYKLPLSSDTLELQHAEQWFQARLAPLPDAPGQPRRVAWLSTDITERKLMEHRLAQPALLDPLTESWNEPYFLQTLNQEITRQERYKEPFCLLLLELEHSDTIRVQFGVDAADNCIREVARLTRRELRHSDVLGRLGSDLFAIILVNTTMSWALEVGQRIAIRASRTPFATPGRTLYLSLNGGLTDFRSDDTAANMMQRAQKALNKSQTTGRDRVSVA
jgi:diguanylate cyclase (GGDEF)-like protein